MKFCPICKNMLFNIEENNGIAVHTCRKCAYTEPIGKENPVVYEHNIHEDKTANLAINPYLEYDATLTHLHNMICPNLECKYDPDIVAIKINAEKLIWMYKCVGCKYMWKQSARAAIA